MAVDKDVQRASKIVRPQLPWTQSYRHHLALLAFLGFFNVYALRVNLSVAVVKMAEDFNWSNAQKGRCTRPVTLPSAAASPTPSRMLCPLCSPSWAM